MKKYVRPLLFALTGAALGLGYFYFFGCNGTCAITSNPWLTMAYSGILGLLLSSVAEPKKENS